MKPYHRRCIRGKLSGVVEMIAVCELDDQEFAE
jgi:hypothetical protein